MKNFKLFSYLLIQGLLFNSVGYGSTDSDSSFMPSSQERSLNKSAASTSGYSHNIVLTEAAIAAVENDESITIADPAFDSSFKKLFEDEKIAMCFLKEFLEPEFINRGFGEITEISLQGPDTTTVVKNSHGDIRRNQIFFDVCWQCTCEKDGKIVVVDVEMQNKNVDYYLDRVLYYGAKKIAQQQPTSKKPYDAINPVYIISFLNHSTYPEKDMIYQYAGHLDFGQDDISPIDASSAIKAFFIQLPLTMQYLEKHKNINPKMKALYELLSIRNMKLFNTDGEERVSLADENLLHYTLSHDFKKQLIDDLDNDDKDFIIRILGALHDIKTSQEYAQDVETYQEEEMAYQNAAAQGREEGKAEGREEGKAEGREEGLQQGLDKGKKLERKRTVVSDLSEETDPSEFESKKSKLSQKKLYSNDDDIKNFINTQSFDYYKNRNFNYDTIAMDLGII